MAYVALRVSRHKSAKSSHQWHTVGNIFIFNVYELSFINFFLNVFFKFFF